MTRRSWLSLALAGCVLEGDGRLAETSREVPRFDRLEVFGAFEVEVRVRPELEGLDTVTVRLAGDDNALGRLFTQVHGGDVLTIAVDPNLQTELTLTPSATLEVPALDGVYAAGTTRVTVLGASGELLIEAREGARVDVRELTRGRPDVLASGRAVVTLAGEGSQIGVEAAEDAAVDASAFRARAAAVLLADRASAKICSELTPEIEGAEAQVLRLCAE